MVATLALDPGEIELHSHAGRAVHKRDVARGQLHVQRFTTFSQNPMHERDVGTDCVVSIRIDRNDDTDSVDALGCVTQARFRPATCNTL